MCNVFTRLFFIWYWTLCEASPNKRVIVGFFAQCEWGKKHQPIRRRSACDRPASRRHGYLVLQNEIREEAEWKLGNVFTRRSRVETLKTFRWWKRTRPTRRIDLCVTDLIGCWGGRSSSPSNTLKKCLWDFILPTFISVLFSIRDLKASQLIIPELFLLLICQLKLHSESLTSDSRDSSCEQFTDSGTYVFSVLTV